MVAAQKKLVVIAMGGNSLIRHKDRRSVEDQYDVVCETMQYVANVIESGWQVVVTHGNGPQVGFMMLRSELARTVLGLHMLPLVSCVANSQGAIGYQIQQALDNALEKRHISARTVTLVTQVCVDPADPGFLEPDKFVGEFYTEDQLEDLTAQHPQWIIKKDSNRGWRRVVPAPKPLEIVEEDAIKALLAGGFNLVAVGGGGVPVIRSPENCLLGVDAVIDKDLATCLLANAIGAELLIISTAVPHVCLHYGSPHQTPLHTVSVSEMEKYLAEGHFPAANMGPKVQAAVDFVHGGGKEALITTPDKLEAAMAGKAGTRIVRDDAV